MTGDHADSVTASPERQQAEAVDGVTGRIGTGRRGCPTTVDADNRLCDISHIMPQPKTQTPMTAPLKHAIIESGLPLLTLEQQTGIKRASIMRFLRGDSSLRLDKADILAAYFGLSLQPMTPVKTAPPKRKGK